VKPRRRKAKVGMCGKVPYGSRKEARAAKRAAKAAAARRGQYRLSPDIHGCSNGCPPGTWHLTLGRARRKDRPRGR
jgi:hypothetical protein